jgi:transcriptional regulator with XRE-family HTH domain
VDAIGIGARIRARRQELGLTQQQLAERVGVARQWVVRLERGNPRAELDPLLRTIFELELDLFLEPALDDNSLDEYLQSFTKRAS